MKFRFTTYHGFLHLKTFTCALPGILLAFSNLCAQPVVSNNEYYHIGDTYQFVTGDFTNLTIDSSGANVTWDYTLMSQNGTEIMSILSDTTPGFSTSNLMVLHANGRRDHVSQNSSDTYINGIYDPGTGLTTLYTVYDVAKRPFTYMTTYLDSYRVNIPLHAYSGKGYLTVTGTSYGTLKLPGHVYNNVLLVKKQVSELDTSGSPAFTTFLFSTSYLWFDGIHPAPLLEIDSVNSGMTGRTISARYLNTQTATPEITGNPSISYGSIFNDELFISAPLKDGETYSLHLFDLSGRTIYTSQFIGVPGTLKFQTGLALPAGIYLASIIDINNNGDKILIKLIKG